ncbi:unnamed protein product [Brachionus calyciflorus]|uniref:Uncharacterized protein n=1 Tax=Brachionus calyciflorus TaxID=104777 RepID=A0A814I1N9_9BILA|nr:unnamed protein product [Brachionus calyciflorus]
MVYDLENMVLKAKKNGPLIYLKSLQTLELSTSDLQIIEPKLFNRLENLENLIFQTYRIKKLNLTLLKKLKTLKIQASEFPILSKETIQYTNCLKKLEIKNSTLTRVENDAFSTIPNLKELFIQCNHEKSKLCENTFSSLRELQVLFLNGNGIQTKQNGQFDHLNSLKLLDLNLEINDLENIEENFFDYENNLKYVCLKLNNSEFYNQFNMRHLNGLNNLEYFEMRIKNFNDYGIDKVEEKDKELIDIINSKLLNCNCEVDYFLSCCLIKTNIGTKEDFI